MKRRAAGCFGWIVVPLVGAIAAICWLGVLGTILTPSAWTLVLALVAVGGTLACAWLYRRLIRPPLSEAMTRALARLPRGAVVRRGRVPADSGRTAAGMLAQGPLSPGLERTIQDGRIAAIVWDYPWGPGGEERLAGDRRWLEAAGFRLVLVERDEPRITPPAVGIAALVVSTMAGVGAYLDDRPGRIRALFRRTIP